MGYHSIRPQDHGGIIPVRAYGVACLLDSAEKIGSPLKFFVSPGRPVLRACLTQAKSSLRIPHRGMWQSIIKKRPYNYGWPRFARHDGGVCSLVHPPPG